ncbi:hypothetical protein PF004_g24552 [Phytophthora fragariae]|uniref:Uncharacterized protein n=1 Tax=Phytophthora fragariae TaxID=53985 RepID=A0A6G0MTV5_9STRA|nr:hypothetical protein PF004_g24552 [Phytophthora fragariae]
MLLPLFRKVGTAYDSSCNTCAVLDAMPTPIGAAAVTSLPSKPLQQSRWSSPGHSHDMRLLIALHEVRHRLSTAYDMPGYTYAVLDYMLTAIGVAAVASAVVLA